MKSSAHWHRVGTVVTGGVRWAFRCAPLPEWCKQKFRLVHKLLKIHMSYMRVHADPKPLIATKSNELLQFAHTVAATVCAESVMSTPIRRSQEVGCPQRTAQQKFKKSS